MITTYHTLKALVDRWRGEVAGREVLDVYTQNPDELLIAVDGEPEPTTVHVSVEAQFPYLFRSAGYHKARANAVTLLEEAVGHRVEELRIADRDRMIFFELEGGPVLQIQLFGTRANVFLVEEGEIVDAFKHAGEVRGEEAPEPRTAPRVDTWEAFRDRWQADRNDLKQAVSFTDLTLDRTLGAEVLYRSGLEEKRPDRATEEEKRRLFEAYREVMGEFEDPAPRIYWEGDAAEQFSLIALRHLEEGPYRAEQEGEVPSENSSGTRSTDPSGNGSGVGERRRVEPFDELDTAVRIFTTRRLARRHFEEVYRPLREKLENVRDRLARSLERIEEEISGSSSADRYERWGHLLMSEGGGGQRGREEAELEDLFEEDEGTVTIPLDPAKTTVENAEAYYEKARRARTSREEAEGRLEETRARFERADRLLEELGAVEDRDELKAYKREHEEELARILGREDREGERVPFRQFRVQGDYEVWVGKNAKQNDELLSSYARKYDYWMHARNVPGSHVILRRHDRDKEPPKAALYEAAAIAAHYSQARGSSVVPVQVTQRKYIHKPKGAPAGRVRVDREEVLMVEPGLPE